MLQHATSVLEEELKRGEKLSVGWPWRLLSFAIIVFGLTAATYLGMSFGYKPYLNSRIKELDSRITNLTQQIDATQQENLISFYSQLVNVKELLNSHPAISKIFDFLEKNVHNQVYYVFLNLSLNEKSIKIEGIAPDYHTLVKQLELFQRAPEIEKLFLEDSRALEGGETRFSIRLIFKSEMVK